MNDLLFFSLDLSASEEELSDVKVLLRREAAGCRFVVGFDVEGPSSDEFFSLLLV